MSWASGLIPTPAMPEKWQRTLNGPTDRPNYFTIGPADIRPPARAKRPNPPRKYLIFRGVVDGTGYAITGPPREDAMDTETVEARAVTVKGRFCSSPNTASGGYIAGLLGRLMAGPSRVSLEQPVPVDRALGIERLSDGALALTDGVATLAHASPAALQLEPPVPVSYAEAEWASERYLGVTGPSAPAS